MGQKAEAEIVHCVLCLEEFVLTKHTVYNDDLQGYICDHCEESHEEGFCNDDLGMCPHGSTDDEGCEEPGCYGGPDSWDDDW